jgi:ferredoxin/flavodoxin---NADP+ reductase
MSAFHHETVKAVHHWTDSLFSFETSRTTSLRFRNGEFVMVGLEIDGKPLLRAYSIASANHDEHLEFFSIKVVNGPLTSRLQKISIGDAVLVGKKPVGTLVIDNLLPGQRLYLLATGTGIAPFISIMRDPLVYAAYEQIILVHGCRRIADLDFGRRKVESLLADPFFGPEAQGKLAYVPTVTREPFHNEGRITDLIRSGQLSARTGAPPLNLQDDRVMLCGSPAMIADCKQMLLDQHFTEGSHGVPGHFVLEKAFAER